MTSVLILAGLRHEECPLSSQAGVVSKALIELAGVRMIDHVLRALRDASDLTGTIWVSGLPIERIAEGLPDDLTEFSGRLVQAPTRDGPATAALAILEGGATLPLLITTCDHPLLSPNMISYFIREARGAQSDFSVGLAPRSVIAPAYPHVKRTYIKLGGMGYSGCNLFYVARDKGRRAIAFWQDVGRDRKKPLKIAGRFGYGALIRMLTGRLGLNGAFEYGSRRVGAHITPVLIPIAEAAIDVDKPSDLALVREILEKRAMAAGFTGLRL